MNIKFKNINFKNNKMILFFIICTLITFFTTTAAYAWFTRDYTVPNQSLVLNDWSLPNVYINILDSNGSLDTSMSLDTSVEILVDKFTIPDGNNFFIIPYNVNENGFSNDKQFTDSSLSFFVNAPVENGKSLVSYDYLMHGTSSNPNGYKFALSAPNNDLSNYDISYTISYENFSGNTISAPPQMPSVGGGFETEYIPLSFGNGVYLRDVVFSLKPIPKPIPTEAPTSTPIPTETTTSTPVPTETTTSTPIPTETPIPTAIPTATATLSPTSTVRPPSNSDGNIIVNVNPTSTSEISTPKPSVTPYTSPVPVLIQPTIPPGDNIITTSEPETPIYVHVPEAPEPISTTAPENTTKIIVKDIPYEVEQDPDSGEYLVYDEDGILLGAVEVPEDKTLEEVIIENFQMPAGQAEIFDKAKPEAKPNPKTIDSNKFIYYLFPFIIAAFFVITKLMKIKKLRN